MRRILPAIQLLKQAAKNLGENQQFKQLTESLIEKSLDSINSSVALVGRTLANNAVQKSAAVILKVADPIAQDYFKAQDKSKTQLYNIVKLAEIYNLIQPTAFTANIERRKHYQNYYRELMKQNKLSSDEVRELANALTENLVTEYLANQFGKALEQNIDYLNADNLPPEELSSMFVENLGGLVVEQDRLQEEEEEEELSQTEENNEQNIEQPNIVQPNVVQPNVVQPNVVQPYFIPPQADNPFSGSRVMDDESEISPFQNWNPEQLLTTLDNMQEYIQSFTKPQVVSADEVPTQTDVSTTVQPEKNKSNIIPAQVKMKQSAVKNMVAKLGFDSSEWKSFIDLCANLPPDTKFMKNRSLRDSLERIEKTANFAELDNSDVMEYAVAFVLKAVSTPSDTNTEFANTEAMSQFLDLLNKGNIPQNISNSIHKLLQIDENQEICVKDIANCKEKIEQMQSVVEEHGLDIILSSQIDNRI